MLIAWVWQDAIPSYEKATLLDGKRGFFLTSSLKKYVFYN